MIWNDADDSVINQLLELLMIIIFFSSIIEIQNLRLLFVQVVMTSFADQRTEIQEIDKDFCLQMS